MLCMHIKFRYMGFYRRVKLKLKLMVKIEAKMHKYQPLLEAIFSQNFEYQLELQCQRYTWENHLFTAGSLIKNIFFLNPTNLNSSNFLKVALKIDANNSYLCHIEHLGRKLNKEPKFTYKILKRCTYLLIYYTYVHQRYFFAH